MDGATRKTNQEIAQGGATRKKSKGLHMMVQYRRTYNRRLLVGGVIYKEGKELTYRQVSQLLETPDAVKTCLHSLHSSPTRKKTKLT